jgi:hypothetical protein
MQIREGAYYRTRDGDVFGRVQHSGEQIYCWCVAGWSWTVTGKLSVDNEEDGMDFVSEVWVSDTPPSDDVMLNLSEIARTKSPIAMGEGNFGMDENPPCGIRLRWLVEVVDSLQDTPIFRASNPFIHPAPDGPNGPFRIAPETKTLRDEFVMRLMDRDMFAVGFIDEAKQLYRVADAMMEARKK